jgi:hypothetical protein
MDTSKITVLRARELLRYDPETGSLFWRFSRGGRLAGSRAGHLQIFPKNKNRRTEKKYWVIRIDGVLFLAHHIIWLIVKGQHVKRLDHQNGDSTDNVFTNLREATHRQNMQNTKKRIDNKSGYKGVSWDSINEKWVVRIRVPEGKYENLGRFKRAEDGAQEYRRRAIELYGIFARAA